MQKPQQIIELEKELGFELEETKTLNELSDFEIIDVPIKGIAKYIQNDMGVVTHLTLYNIGLKDIGFLKKFTSLASLNLSKNSIQDISVLSNLDNLIELILYENSISNLFPLSKLTKLENLSISYNLVSSVDSLQYLVNLKILRTGNNSIADILPLQHLTNLTELRFGVNHVIDVSVIKKLSKLKHLRIHLNPINSAQQIQEIVEIPALEYLDLFGIRANIPYEFLSNGYNDNCLFRLRDYFQSIKNEEDRRELNEAKLIFVGYGGVGKSELADALSEENYVFEPNRKETKGICIKKWQLQNCQKNDKPVDFDVNIWDFSGQEINHNAHHFFLTKNSLYVLLWNKRSDEDITQYVLKYWLDTIQQFAPSSPVIVVRSKIDEEADGIDLEKLKKDDEKKKQEWKELYPNIICFHHVGCEKGIGIDELREIIRQEITKFSTETWNKHRVNIRKQLEESPENYISYSTYFQLCRENQLNKEEADFLAKHLHKLGIVLHFENDKRYDFEETLVLKPEWATQALYKLIGETSKLEGRFKRDELRSFWQEKEYEDKREYLLNLMHRFYLVLNIERTDTYIIPHLLPENPVTELPVLPQKPALCFEYHYSFSPSSIFTHFVCLNAHFVQTDHLWKNGVILKNGSTTAKVTTSQLSKYICIEVGGENASEFLTVLRNNMQEVHERILQYKPMFEEKIPCSCPECQQTDYSKRHQFNYKFLKKLDQKGKEHTDCIKSAEEVSVKELLTGIKPVKTKDDLILENQEEMKIKLDEIKANTEQILALFSQEFSQLKQNLSLAEEERFRLLSELIDKQKPQNLDFYAQEAKIAFPKFNILQADSQYFVAMGFYFLEILPNSGDFSPPALQFCRALELEMKTVFDNFKTSKTVTYANQKSLFSINKEEEKTFGIFYRFTEQNGYVMLNQMIYVLLKINELRLSNLFSDFENYLSAKDLVGLNPKIEDLKDKDYRNKSAHTHPILKTGAEDCKELILQALGLWL